MEVSRKFGRVKPSSTLSIDAKFKQMRAAGIDVVGFGAGEPDFDTPSHIKQAAIDAINAGYTKYTPASGSDELKDAICAKLKRENNLLYDKSQIIVSNGAKHSLMNALGAILNPGDEVILPAPYWVSYSEMVSLNDGINVIVYTTEEQGFKFTPAQFKAAITDKTKAIIINSPSNPTGMLYSKEQLQELAQIAVDNNIYIISDEIYEHLIYGDSTHVSIPSLSPEIYQNTILINGASKAYSMTGWRIGFTASNQQLAKAMANTQSHATSNPNSIAQKAAVAAYNGSLDFVHEMRDEFMKRRDYMVDTINSIPNVSCLKPEGAFYVMMNIKAILGKQFQGKIIETSDDFCDILLDNAKVALVPGSGFGAEGYVRWSYATSIDTIKEGLSRVEQFVKKL